MYVFLISPLRLQFHSSLPNCNPFVLNSTEQFLSHLALLLETRPATLLRYAWMRTKLGQFPAEYAQAQHEMAPELAMRTIIAENNGQNGALVLFRGDGSAQMWLRNAVGALRHKVRSQE